MDGTGTYIRRASFQTIKEHSLTFDEHLSPESIAVHQYSVFPEHHHLKQDPSPFRQFPLMPALSSQVPSLESRYSSLQGLMHPDVFVSGGGPRSPIPTTPHLTVSEHRTVSRPPSEADGSHHSSPFTPKSNGDVFLPSENHHMTDQPHGTSYQDPPYCQDDIRTDHGQGSYHPAISHELSNISPHLWEQGQTHPQAYFISHTGGPVPGVHAVPPHHIYGHPNDLSSEVDAPGELEYDENDEDEDADADDGHPDDHKEPPRRPRQQPVKNPESGGRSAHSRHQFHCDKCDYACERDTLLKKHIRKNHEQPYICIFRKFGCEEVFGTKNEWARHVRVQHLRLETWRCTNDTCGERGAGENTLPPSARRTNDYGRKDLFLEHMKRIHKNLYSTQLSGEQAKIHLDKLQKRARLTLRHHPRRTSCPCCNQVWTDFDGWLEHIAKEMELNPGRCDDFCDAELQQWMIHQELLEPQGRGKWKLEGATRSRGPAGRSKKARRAAEDGRRVAESSRKRVQPRRQHKLEVRRSRPQ